MDFKNVPKKYRPIPFWSWNDCLDTEETKRQVHMMNEVGIGGFFMHARGGLQTPYMGEEWFENVDAATKAAKDCGMYAWAYDENGWPSGFGDGKVNGMGIEYQQKYLRMSDTEPDERVIAKSGEHWFYYDVNPFYVDTLDSKVVKEFIDVAYLPYYERYHTQLEGFFTDEPQISRDGIPWSFVFEREYFKRYGDNLLEHLEELFLPKSNYKETRIRFWKMVTELFSEAFCKQIYEWCQARGLKLTGHLVLEEGFIDQLTTNGAVMPHYEYFDIPGMDWLGRNITDCLTPIQVSSVAQQLGKEAVLSETFALCGHNVSFSELKGIYEWQMAHGINLLCQHLEGYTLRGIRKRDYPPAMYYQQPWWNEYGKLVDALSREGMVLANGKAQAEYLLFHPQTTAWSMFDNEENKGIDELNNEFLQAVKTLEQKHISFHLGDEIIMERHARVENGRLIIGNQSYKYVLNPCGTDLLPSTINLLKKFVVEGGSIITPDEVEINNVIDREDITYTSREYDEFKVHYFVNTSSEYKKAILNVSGKQLDIYTGETKDLSSEYEFEPWGSLMVIDNGEQLSDNVMEKTEVFIPETLNIMGDVRNVLTLDKCDYYFDGELQEQNGYVLNITERANKLERSVHIKQVYTVNVKEIPDNIQLVCETPSVFKISVNGIQVNNEPLGTFCDSSFICFDVAEYVKTGINEIIFECDFVQSDEFYDNMRKAAEFESEKNKLVYDMEIEPIYLVGSFGIETDGEWTELERDAVRYKGEFSIVSPPERIETKHIEKSGFPFFCGSLTAECEIDINGTNPVLCLNKKGINAVTVEINGKSETLLTSDRLLLNKFGVNGKTHIRLTLTNNLRNMLGPHHLKEGETFSVAPCCFFKEPCVWNDNSALPWDDDYCFVVIGI